MESPSVQEITDQFHKDMKFLYEKDPLLLTVNNIRKTTANHFGLEPQFFKSEEWKEKSKAIITQYSAELTAEGEASEVASTPVTKAKPSPAKKGKKRVSSTNETSGPKKRQKKEETPASIGDPMDEDESAVSEVPQAKKGKRASTTPKKPVKRKAHSDSGALQSEEESKPKKVVGRKRESKAAKAQEFSDSEDKPKAKKEKSASGKKETKARPIIKTLKADATEHDGDGLASGKDVKSKTKSLPKAMKQKDSESELSDVPDEKFQTKRASSIKKQEDSESELSELKDEDLEIKTSKAEKLEDESEMSDVLDETPKPKRHRKSKSEMAASKDKPKSAPSSSTKPKTKAKAKTASADVTPQEAEIKTLQSQLVKCGIKKAWGIYLKQFGDDSKAKIKHLKEMLKDAGITGRFSNERAAEVKEARELAADLEAVKEGEEKWGMGSGRRARSAAQSMKQKHRLGSDEDEDGNDGNDSGDEQDSDAAGKNSRSRSSSAMAPLPSRSARRHPDLAFLGSEDEDSD